MNRTPGTDFERVLGPFSAMAIVIGAIIGVGIFFNPATVAAVTGSQSLAMTAWMVGGLIAVFGALTFAELGGVYSRTGGQYEILRDAFGSLIGFVYVFCNATAVQAGAIAIIAFLTAQNLLVAMGIDPEKSPSLVMVIASFFIIAVTVTNNLGVRWGSLTQNITVIAKLLTIFLIVVLAVTFAGPSFRDSVPAKDAADAAVANSTWAILFAAVVHTLFAFGGWQHALWIGGEVKNPVRNIPFSIIAGVAVVIAAYLSVNWAYFRLLGFEGVAQSKALAADAVTQVWPAFGRRFVAAAVAFSALGVLNAQMLSGPRLICGMARDGNFFSMFARLHPRWNTPIASILLLGVLGWGLLLVVGVERVDELTNGVVLLDSCAFLATGLALIVLRYRRTGVVWPFRTPLFPLIPLLFCLGEILVIWGAFGVEKYRRSSSIGLYWILAAILCYFVFFHRRTIRENRL